MRWGLIARSEDRGLGVMLWEMHRHLQPDRTLLVDMGELARGFPMHPDRYPGATVVPWRDGTLPEAPVRAWLAGLDVVYTAETFYDWRVPLWAADAGCAAVCHVMPEFHVERPGLPVVWWAPTTWRLDTLPAGTPVVPVPVATDRFSGRSPERAGPLRVLHVGGHKAMADRNGTNSVEQAVRRVRRPMRVTLASQDTRTVRPYRRGEVQLVVGAPAADYWRLYDDQDVMVLPRRYGGLCLPAQEAMAAGLAVVMTEAEPQVSTWPVRTVPTRGRGRIRTAAGVLQLVAADTAGLAQALDALAAHPADVAMLQRGSLAWAQAHSWEALGPTYMEALARAAG